MPQRKRFDNRSAQAEGLSYLLRRQDRLGGNPDLSLRTPTSGGVTGATDPTFLVAAPDSRPALRNAADFLCGSTNADAEIQSALNALPTAGGRVVLAEGTYDIEAPFGPWQAIDMPDNSQIHGMGPGTVLSCNGANDGTYSAFIQLGAKCVVSDLVVDMAGITNGLQYGLYINDYFTRIEGVIFQGIGQSGQDSNYYTNLDNSGVIVACHFNDVYTGGC